MIYVDQNFKKTIIVQYQLLLKLRRGVYSRRLHILEIRVYVSQTNGSQVFCGLECTEVGNAALYPRSGVIRPSERTGAQCTASPQEG